MPSLSLSLSGASLPIYYRNLKTYFLSDGKSTDERNAVLRVKGVPRRDQDSLPKRIFGQRDNDASVRSVYLKPTRGMELGIFAESKSLPFALITKRKAVVSLAVEPESLPSLTLTEFAGPRSHVGSGVMEPEEQSEVKKFFFARARRGLVPTLADLSLFCARKGIEAESAHLRSLRQKWKFLAVYTRPKRVPSYMGMAVQRYGVVQIDAGFYRPPVLEGSEKRVRRRRNPWEDAPKKSPPAGR